MYIAKLLIRNFRCFGETTIEFRPGINVIIGENNAGKTALLRALGLIFERRRRSRIELHDFHQGIADFSTPPEISVSATLRSSIADTVDDKALVATWLTRLESPWEAQVTYQFFLPEEEVQKFKAALGASAARETFFQVLEQFLPKYVSRIYGGNPESRVLVEPDALAKFECQQLDAIRDVEAEMFSGTNPLLRSLLQLVLDQDADDDEKLTRRAAFRAQASPLQQALKSRLNTKALFELITDTGASDGGSPELHGDLDEQDLIAALKLFITRADVRVPVSHNGLGYNNLIYISVVLASLALKSSVDRLGRNAILFPMLLIEEPEAHLHPALQYKLLKYIEKRLSREKSSRQVFLTTHSTHITAAACLDPIIVLSFTNEGSIRVAYPGKVFPSDETGIASRHYVERYLDATKANILFAKGVIFVEGLAEQLLVPCLAEYLGKAIEWHHVAVIGVGGSTVKHFLPLFGAGVQAEHSAFCLERPIACVVDADPTRRTNGSGPRRGCLKWTPKTGRPDKV